MLEMVNYSNSIIYKLCCKDTNITDIYVGSTTNFYRRKQEHKNCCNNDKGKSYNFNVYQFIRVNGNFENWDMVEIEKYNCNDKRDLHKRERYYIETLEATLNCVIPTQTKKEFDKKYYINNKDKIKDNMKEYYENNKDKLKDNMKEYYENNTKTKHKHKCECGGKYTHYNKSAHEKTKKHLEYLEKQNQH